MNRVTKIIAFSMMVLLGPVPNAQEQPGPSTHAQIFLQTVTEGDIDRAYALLFRGSRIGEDPNALEVIQAQTRTMLSLHGQPLNFERSSEEVFGSSIVRLVYIMKMTDRIPVIWELYYYLPDSSWELLRVQFNDVLGLLGTINPR